MSTSRASAVIVLVTGAVSECPASSIVMSTREPGSALPPTGSAVLFAMLAARLTIVGTAGWVWSMVTLRSAEATESLPA